ncbi:MAG TPA: hypothetical protein VG326_12820 [Tepidisphaeraceae bacterium]|jgi:hypothetical protein|nr:hypothetical protein [Tepidisphaeraceae bacterium]
MKHFAMLAALAAVLTLGAMVHAAGKMPSTGSGKSPPIEGTITDVGSRGFRLSVPSHIPPAKTKDGEAPVAPPEKILVILCDSYTKFQTGGKPATGEVVKTGAHVAITGSQYAVDTVLATVVNATGDAKKK